MDAAERIADYPERAEPLFNLGRLLHRRDDTKGAIASGKDADLVLLTGDPLSSLARVQWTMVDGELEFLPLAISRRRSLSILLSFASDSAKICALSAFPWTS